MDDYIQNYPFSALIGLLHDNTEELLSNSGINKGLAICEPVHSDSCA